MNVQPTPFSELTAIKKFKRVLVAVIGGTVLAVGLALVVLPGPAFLVIPAGLAILAMEFAWAGRWLRKARNLLPKTKPRRKQEAVSISPPVDYFRAKAAASLRNTIHSTRTEIPQQPKSISEPI